MWMPENCSAWYSAVLCFPIQPKKDKQSIRLRMFSSRPPAASVAGPCVKGSVSCLGIGGHPLSQKCEARSISDKAALHEGKRRGSSGRLS